MRMKYSRVRHRVVALRRHIPIRTATTIPNHLLQIRLNLLRILLRRLPFHFDGLSLPVEDGPEKFNSMVGLVFETKNNTAMSREAVRPKEDEKVWEAVEGGAAVELWPSSGVKLFLECRAVAASHLKGVKPSANGKTVGKDDYIGRDVAFLVALLCGMSFGTWSESHACFVDTLQGQGSEIDSRVV